MTTEEKAKAYDKALEKFDVILNLNTVKKSGTIFADDVRKILPELKESEDERIRKELLAVIDDLILPDEQKERFVAWLEKQGEPTEINPSEFDSQLNRLLKQFESLSKEELASSLSFYLNVVQNDGTYKSDEKQDEQKHVAKYKVGDTIYYSSFGRLVSFVIANIVEDGTDNPMYEDKDGNSVFEKDLVEQKPTDKVEPKFKIEEEKWYVCTQTYVLRGKIVVIKGQTYQAEKDNVIKGENGCLFIDRHDGKALDYFRLWTIQDAKDGDVLYECNERKPFIFKELKTKHIGDIASYCDIFNGIFNPNEDDWTTLDIVPATKEQCDTLFAKMKEAGYEWDAEKKNLKRIEQKNEIDIPFIAKDSEFLGANYCIPEGFHAEIKGNRVFIKKGEQNSAWSEEDEDILKTCLYFFNGGKGGISDNRRDNILNWFKSLKERIQLKPKWKPSERDLGSLKDAIIHYEGIGIKPNGLKELLEQLKKLKEE